MQPITTTCNADSVCTDGANGRCVGNGPIAGCHCAYDACADDSACAGGQTCACHGSAYVGSTGSTCVPGNCRVDTDCGTNGYCSPSLAVTNMTQCGVVAGYYCHTASDTCVNDSDCRGTNGDLCVYDAKAQHWGCVVAFPCL